MNSRGILSPSVEVFTEGGNLEAKLIFRAATWLLSVAFVSGLAMAIIRFATDRQSPPWVAKLHGFAAAGAISLLVFVWVNTSLTRLSLYGLLTLLVAAAVGLLLSLGYHWKQKPLPEGLVFVHMSVAFIGFLLVGVVTISLAP
jgi:Ca2+/Na+ antiporter